MYELPEPVSKSALHLTPFTLLLLLGVLHQSPQSLTLAQIYFHLIYRIQIFGVCFYILSKFQRYGIPQPCVQPLCSSQMYGVCFYFLSKFQRYGSNLLSPNLSHIDVWCLFLHFKQVLALRHSAALCLAPVQFIDVWCLFLFFKQVLALWLKFTFT